MRRMFKYIYENHDWPEFYWEDAQLVHLLAKLRHEQGRFMGRMESLGFQLRGEAALQNLTLDILKSNEIEGELLNREQVRSSVARHLGMDIAGMVRSDRNVDAFVEMMIDATTNYNELLSKERLFNWHAALFPNGRSGMHKITVAAWRTADNGPMQVVSGALGKEKVHFEAPEAAALEKEMDLFIDWVNANVPIDPVLKAGIAHLWFLSIHPFDDGNGRIARAIAEMLLARADGSAQRFYSMSAQIQRERNAYYSILESTQKGTLNITQWLLWFINCLDLSLLLSNETLSKVLFKAKFWETNANKGFNGRQHHMLNKLLDGFEGKLVSSKWAKICKCSQDTALRDIQDLLDKKVLQKENAGGRSTSYVLCTNLSSNLLS